MSGSPFSREETAAILAGLRLLQRLGSYTSEIEEILTDGGELEPLSVNEIDDLCMMVNNL